MSEATEPDLTGMTFHEIAAKYGEETAIQAGIEADPEWGPGEMDMSKARPAMEVMPDLVELLEREEPGRGKQQKDAPAKEEVSIQLDSDLMAVLRGMGEDWQHRMNAILRRAVFGDSRP